MLVRACTDTGRIVGSDNASAKFSDEQVETIKHLRADGLTYAAIAKQVGCCLAYAQKVVAGKLRGIAPTRTVATLTEDDLPTVRAYHAQGFGAERIARGMGASFSSVLILVNQAKQLDGPPRIHQHPMRPLNALAIAKTSNLNAEKGGAK